MIEELKAWLNREPQAGQAVSILAKHGPALIAAVELAESADTLFEANGDDAWFESQWADIETKVDAYRAAKEANND